MRTFQRKAACHDHTDITGSKRIAYVGSNYYRCGQTAAGLIHLMTSGEVHVGIVSGAKVDKSCVFDWTPASNGAPLIDDAPVSMALDLLDIYDANGCYLLICKVRETFAREELLNEKGKLDFAKYKPVLFEPGFRYLRTGDVIEPCVAPGKAFAAEQGID